jgi:hypothetical protein
MAVTGYVWPDEEEVTTVASRCHLQSWHYGADGKLLCRSRQLPANVRHVLLRRTEPRTGVIYIYAHLGYIISLGFNTGQFIGRRSFPFRTRLADARLRRVGGRVARTRVALCVVGGAVGSVGARTARPRRLHVVGAESCAVAERPIRTRRTHRCALQRHGCPLVARVLISCETCRRGASAPYRSLPHDRGVAARPHDWGGGTIGARVARGPFRPLARTRAATAGWRGVRVPLAARTPSDVV